MSMSEPVSLKTVDLLTGVNTECQVYEPGYECFVRLVDVSPRLVKEGYTADQAIIDAARVSYGEGTKRVNEDRGLIRYLLRHRHTTPFEMVQFKFHLRMPVYVYRQFFRHRSNEQCEIEVVDTDETTRKYVSMNEYSARYSKVPDKYYVPFPLRIQSTDNKQGGETPSPELTDKYRSRIEDTMKLNRALYEDMLNDGVSREIARSVLPVAYVTEFYCSFNLWNLLHFLALRVDEHAQKEIRQYAQPMLEFVRKVCPISYEAWIDYVLDARTFSRMELDVIRSIIKKAGPELLGNEMKENGYTFSAREFKELLGKLRIE